MKTILVMLFITATLYASAQDTSVVKMEYFIDTDPGVGKATSLNIPAANDITFPFTVDVSSYSIGYHKLYIRTKDDLGRWSLTTRRNIEVISSAINNNVVNGEYFIDTDPGFGVASAISIATPDTAVLQNFTAATAALSEGYHKLYGRFKDTHGNWSHTFRRNIEIIKSDTNKVVNGEYFFKTDNGFGNCSPVVFVNPAADGTFAFNIPTSQIPADADTLFIRIRDDIENRWSLTQIASVANGTLPVTLLNFTISKLNTTSLLSWQTTNEINVAYFDVQRSTDGIHFINVGKVNTDKVISTQHAYSFNDDISALQAGKIFYKLQMTDNDGTISFSKIVSVSIDAKGFMISIHPNPAHNYFIINKSGNADLNNAALLIRDITGRTLVNQKLTDEQQQSINISMLSKGTYIVTIITNGDRQTQKLIVQ